jgi:SMC interacting uncharacterized protein involved in chromosome segregation
LNKKREQELLKLRRELEDSALEHESTISALRKKAQDTSNEMADQVDQLTKVKQRLLFTIIDEIRYNYDEISFFSFNIQERMNERMESNIF